MMTATEMIPAVGQQVVIRVEDFRIPVTVKDVRFVWGKPQLLVCPVNGQGEKWVDISRLMPALEHRTVQAGPVKWNGQTVTPLELDETGQYVTVKTVSGVLTSAHIDDLQDFDPASVPHVK